MVDSISLLIDCHSWLVLSTNALSMFTNSITAIFFVPLTRLISPLESSNATVAKSLGYREFSSSSPEREKGRARARPILPHPRKREEQRGADSDYFAAAFLVAVETSLVAFLTAAEASSDMSLPAAIISSMVSD